MYKEARGISKLAQTFLIASNTCQERRPLTNGQLEMPLIPGIVCMAFSVELNFKAIIKAQGKEAKGHILDDLYFMVSEPERTSIVTHTGFSVEEFREKLSRAANAFVDWRYVYEHEGISLDVDFLRKLSVATQQVSAKLTT